MSFMPKLQRVATRDCACTRGAALHASSSGRVLLSTAVLQSPTKLYSVKRPVDAASITGITAASNGHTAAAPPPVNIVGDIMTRNVICVRPDTTIDDALDLIVANKITGLPVVDDEQRVVGVVSDWDLLPLEAITESDSEHPDLFPDVNTSWTAFNDLTIAIAKNAGKIVADVMTVDPLVVRSNTALTDAAQILMKSRVRRLPVVDADGKIAGVISRGNIIAAALAHRKHMRATAN